MTVLNVTNANTRWRVFEKEKLCDTFGDVVNLRVGDLEFTKKLLQENDIKIVFWRPNSDEMTLAEYEMMQSQREILSNVPMINDPKNYLNTHCKEYAFNIWSKIPKITIPKYEIIDDDTTFIKHTSLEFPMLIRLNNEVTGRGSYLIKDRRELQKGLFKLNNNFHHAKSKKSFTKKIAVEFINATKESGKYNMSYRIIVAGNKVVTGYARLSEATDWVAITGKFKYEMGDLFIKYQERCNNMIEKNHDVIVEAVHSLGLNLQGVDIIEDQEGQIYFLECQPGFSTGYSDWAPPFYNPYYPDLVRFIQENKDKFQKRCPMYYNKWLNKEMLFTEIFTNLKEML